MTHDPELLFRLSLSRRMALAGMGAAGAAALLPDIALAASSTGESATFRHGIASGDPDHDSVVLWTRVSPPDGPAGQDVAVEWELSAAPDFARIAASGQAIASAERDHTVKVLAGGLDPGGRWYYRFRARGETSPTGRTRTLPRGRLDRLGIALVSCSNHAFGLFNAYDAIARDRRVDYVLHVGDYIYEYGADQWGSDVATGIGRLHEPAGETITLDDYRRRHAQYKRDAGSRAMLAAHPLLACWDDHESANNPWTGGAQNHNPAREGDWQARRAASIRAYFEWMPVREPGPGRERMQFWRGYSFGDLALLHTLETRHTGRSKQIEYGDWVEPIARDPAAAEGLRAAINAPGRAILSPEMEQDLQAALGASVRAGQPWRLIGSPMIMARTPMPDPIANGVLPPGSDAPTASVAARVLAWKGKLGLPLQADAWDGYPWARERLYDLSRDAGAGDLVVLSGDSHSFWANSLADAAGRRAGIELGTAGVTSPGDFVSKGFTAQVSAGLDRALARFCPEVEWTDNMHQGYVRLDLTRHAGRASFIAVSTVLSPRYRTHVLRRDGIRRNGGSVAFA